MPLSTLLNEKHWSAANEMATLGFGRLIYSGSAICAVCTLSLEGSVLPLCSRIKRAMPAFCFFVTANEATISAGIHRNGKTIETRFNPMIRADDGSLSRTAMIAGVKARAMLRIELLNRRAASSPVRSVWISSKLVAWALPINFVVESNRTILVVPAK